VAAGILLPDGRGIRDPCERGDVDATINMSKQQREDLTASAQVLLRQLQFYRAHEVLGMESLIPRRFMTAKREREEEASEGISSQSDMDQGSPSHVVK